MADDDGACLLGVVGGMSWHATADYHRLANEMTARRRGARHSAQLLVRTLDFAVLLDHVEQGRPEAAGAAIVAAARQLDGAGVRLIVLAANAAHRWFDEVAGAVAGPVLHIADPVAERATELGVRALGVIGTSSATDVYARTGCDLVVPTAARQRRLDELILDELPARQADTRDLPVLAGQIAELVADGAQAVVLACTDFAPIAGRLEAEVPLLDSTSLHVAAALALTARDAA